MYEAFQPTPDLTPYTETVPAVDMNARNSASAPDAPLSRSLDFENLDRVPEHTLDSILWHAMRGRHSRVPRIGPNAS